MEKECRELKDCAGCGKKTTNECSDCARPLCDSVGEGCMCPCQR